nr:PREDICTED: tubulin polyglutamylase complex subunit 1 [Lepisosteus oculatus]
MTKTNMAEKRRSGAVVVEEDSKPPKPDTEREFLSQVGVEGPLRGALLKLLEARAEDPIAFLADHFTNLAQASENGAASGGCGAEQQLRARALWHLGLAHHSQRCAFSNNVRLAYELLAQGGGRRRGGLRGQAYSDPVLKLHGQSSVRPALSRRLCRHELVINPQNNQYEFPRVTRVTWARSHPRGDVVLVCERSRSTVQDRAPAANN